MTSPEQTAKPRNWPMIAIIAITSLTIIAALGGKSGLRYWKAVQRTKLPYYRLEVRGHELVFSTTQNGKPEVLKTIATLKDPSITAGQAGNTINIEIKVGGKTFNHHSTWYEGPIVSPKNRAVFFKEDVPSPKNVLGGTNYGAYTLWRWDEKNGFKKLIPALSHIMTMNLSLDETTLYGNYYEDALKPPFGTFIYTIATGKTSFTGASVYQEANVMVDPDRLILGLAGNTAKGQYIVTNRGFKLSTKTYFDFYIDQTVVQAVGFDGSIWCRAESPGKQSLLRLNKTFDKVEERIDLPATNSPEP